LAQRTLLIGALGAVFLLLSSSSPALSAGGIADQSVSIQATTSHTDVAMSRVPPASEIGGAFALRQLAGHAQPRSARSEIAAVTVLAGGSSSGLPQTVPLLQRQREAVLLESGA
jgi:hypothetical protein